jgi:hypothetical protein
MQLTITGITNSSQWRLGPNGRATLCSKCGAKWARKKNKPTRSSSSPEPLAQIERACIDDVIAQPDPKHCKNARSYPPVTVSNNTKLYRIPSSLQGGTPRSQKSSDLNTEVLEVIELHDPRSPDFGNGPSSHSLEGGNLRDERCTTCGKVSEQIR